MNRASVDLIDKLDWRLRLLHYGLLFMGTEEGVPNQQQIRDDLSMLALEMRQIVEGAESEDSPGHEGPLGPLPPDVANVLE